MERVVFKPKPLMPKNAEPKRISPQKVKSPYRKVIRRQLYKNKTFACFNCKTQFTDYVPKSTITVNCPFCQSVATPL